MPGIGEYRAALKSNHRHYAWKLSFRALLLAVDIALIGMVAWIMDGLISDQYNYYDDWIIAFDLIPIGISFIFCAVVIAYQLLKKKPVHPGWDVGVDLICWIAFAVLGGFTIAIGLAYVGGYYSDPYSYSGSDSGYYITAANGTQVYVPPNDTTQCPAFTSCAEQDAFYSFLRRRGNVEMAIFALMIFAVILHFALFVWGCIDTAAHNSRAVQRDARSLAQTMISEMVANGQIPPPQQPLLFQSPSQRASQVGSQISHEQNPALIGAPPQQPQPAHMQANYGYYAPNEPQGTAMQQHGAWPLQTPAGAQQVNEKYALQANMPPPPRQMPMPQQNQTLPYSQQRQSQSQPQLQLPSPLSPIGLPDRAESPTIPPFVPTSGTKRRVSSNPLGQSTAPQDSNGWHTPPTQQQAGAASSSDALAGGPSVPTRAPGHTASRRVSNASGNPRQSIASNDGYGKNQF